MGVQQGDSDGNGEGGEKLNQEGKKSQVLKMDHGTKSTAADRKEGVT